MVQIDLNCDLGEGFGAYKAGMDEEVIPLITSANIACGFHAGDPLVMEKTVELCRSWGVAAGAHPGFPDLLGFGRREMKVSLQEVGAYITYQIGALKEFCQGGGIRLTHVKPHGALYNMASRDYELASVICQAVCRAGREVPIMALSGSAMIEAAWKTGIPFISEVFADRAYMSDGTLVPRSRPDGMIHDVQTAARRVARMVLEGKVETVDGSDISIQADSVCVHGDNVHALEFIKGIREVLKEEGIEIKHPR